MSGRGGAAHARERAAVDEQSCAVVGDERYDDIDSWCAFAGAIEDQQLLTDIRDLLEKQAGKPPG